MHLKFVLNAKLLFSLSGMFYGKISTRWTSGFKNRGCMLVMHCMGCVLVDVMILKLFSGMREQMITHS